jgi:hypothetical protein
VYFTRRGKSLDDIIQESIDKIKKNKEWRKLQQQTAEKEEEVKKEKKD